MATPFQTEAWTLYGVGMVILLFRVIVRTRQVGFHWEGDDYFTILAIIFFTVELCMLELIGQNGTIVGMTDEIALTLTQGQKDKLVLGSKLLLVGWITYTTLIWCLKGCLLFFYNRLTLNLAQHRLVKVTSVTCIVAYIATITVYLTHCHPLPRLWQVYPYPGDDCALGTSNYYSLVVTNIVTDLMVLYIPLPLLWKVQLPLSKKIKFGVWLCGGIFIIVATLLRCIFALKDSNSINISTIWSIRETFVGIICVNLPVLKPFFNGVKNAISSATRSSNNESSHPLSTVNNTKKGGLGIKKTVHTFTEIDDSESVKDLAKGIDPEWGMARAESRTSSGDEFEGGKKTPPRR